MTESDLKDALMDTLPGRYRGALFYRHAATPYGRSGVSDIVGVVRGTAVYIEAKSPLYTKDAYQALRPSQRAFGEKVRRAGGIFIATIAVDECIEQLDAALVELSVRPE